MQVLNHDGFVWSKVTVSSSSSALARRYHTAIIYKQWMYVFGGFGSDQKPRNDMHRLDLTAEQPSWSVVEGNGDIPCPRYGHIGVLHNNRLYIHGGNKAKYTALDDFYVFDLDTLVWTKIEAPNAPDGRYYHAGAVVDEKLYIFGGAKTNKVYHKDLVTFDFRTYSWENINIEDPPQARAGHVLFPIGRKLYLYGGFGGEGGYDSYTEMYSLDLDDPTKRFQLIEAQETSNLPNTARSLSGVVVGDNFYIFGGYDGAAKVPQGKLICYYTKYNLWKIVTLSMAFGSDVLPPMASSVWYDPTPRYGHSCVLYNNSLIIYAGCGSLFLGDVIKIDM